MLNTPPLSDDCLVTVKLAKESFEICKEHNFVNIHGSIEIATYKSDPLFSLPSFLQIHLVGEERVESKIHYILDDIYQISTVQDDWIQQQENRYELAFQLSVPNDIPSSIQFNQLLDGVYYHLKIKVANKLIIQPIHLHHATLNNNSTKVYWGIVNQQEAKWRFEIEFPNRYNLVSSNHHLCVRFKSMTPQLKQKQFDDCCLLGFQIIQSIQREG